VLVGLGSIHRWHHSDSLAPMLVSLQRWTPFLWEQDRIGMLVPLLALPVRHPLLNLIAQDVIYLFAGLTAFYLLPRYLLRNGCYPLAGTLSALAFLLFAPAAWCHDFACNTFYGVWLSLGLAALIVAEEREECSPSWVRSLIALVLLILAHWVYSAAILVFAPLVVLRFLLYRRVESAGALVGYRSELIRHLALIGASFAVGYILMCLPWDAEPTRLGTLPMQAWPRTLAKLVWVQWCFLTPHHWPFFLLGVGLAGLAYLGVSEPRLRDPLVWRSATVLLGCAAVFVLFMATREWMQLNMCNWRYTHPAVFLVQAVAAILAVAPMHALLGDRSRPVALATAPLLLVGALLHYHAPSLAGIHHDLDDHLGVYTADVLDARCTHVAGGYWRVWPIVFHANLALRERHEPRTIWGIGPRGRGTQPCWRDLPIDRLRIAVPVGDMKEAEGYLRRQGVPALEVIEKRATIWVLGRK
jgi:hypothetical protein